MKKDNSYLPVDPDFLEVLEMFLLKEIKVFFFGLNDKVEESKGKLNEIEEDTQGEFLDIAYDKHVRLDKVITINGRPGPAYERYDLFANACLSCQAGYDD